MSWNLTRKLLAAKLSGFGETIAQALAAFDPVTATSVDRNNLAEKLREVAMKLAGAKAELAKETQEAKTLAEQIARDEKAAKTLIEKHGRGEVDDATLNQFADNLEEMRARLPREQQDVTEAKELVDTLQDILNTIETKLSEFDKAAEQATRAIAQAQADKERQDLRLQNQAEMRSLQTGLGSSSTALGALSRRAEQLRQEADAKGIEAEIGQRPLDRANAVEEARRIAEGSAVPAGESAADRLRRMTS